ncbi:hypothetical protein E2C01_017842 [Portunus trituberculatus]|uniref:Uncharacterized protein n=1 Tax=Portunus trituberculatus TaxID=210409 RepID=A0A5B7DUL1_PORTR|nr:hypothetical protein [Portunus trituberculatus]
MSWPRHTPRPRQNGWRDAGRYGGETGRQDSMGCVYVKRRASESDAAMVSETQDSELMVFRAPRAASTTKHLRPISLLVALSCPVTAQRLSCTAPHTLPQWVVDVPTPVCECPPGSPAPCLPRPTPPRPSPQADRHRHTPTPHMVQPLPLSLTCPNQAPAGST